MRSLHRTLVRVALSAGHVFAWVFIFQYFYVRYGSLDAGLSSTLLTYALSQVTTVLLTPLFASFVRYGFKRLLIYSTLLLSTAFAVLAVSFAGYLGTVEWGIGLFAACLGLYRALYFVPYALSKELLPGRTNYFREFAVAFAPLVAGLALSAGPAALVALPASLAALLALSILPLLTLPDVREVYSWGYRQTFHELFARSRVRTLLGTLMSGVEGAALLLLWPLLVFMLLNWSYTMLSFVLSSTFVLALVLRTLLARPVSRMSMPTAALVNASAWLMRLSVGGALGVVLVDTYFYVGSRPKRRSLDMHTLEQSADNSTYVDENTALKEMGLALGRTLLCLLAVVLLGLVSVPFTFLILFVLTALAAAYSVYLGA
jgi:hypothetical protein